MPLACTAVSAVTGGALACERTLACTSAETQAGSMWGHRSLLHGCLLPPALLTSCSLSFSLKQCRHVPRTSLYSVLQQQGTARVECHIHATCLHLCLMVLIRCCALLSAEHRAMCTAERYHWHVRALHSLPCADAYAARCSARQ